MDENRGNVGEWTLNGTFAELRMGQLTGRVDVAQPERGFHEIELAERRFACQLLHVRRETETGEIAEAGSCDKSSWPLKVGDAYVRGSDLVASYSPADNWPYSPQIYWRAGTLNSIDDVVGSLSLLISVQTHLLDTWPRISVSSHVACREALLVKRNEAGAFSAEPLDRDCTMEPTDSACCLLFRPEGEPLSYAEIMAPNDFCEVSIRPKKDGQCSVRWDLFADFLEKGVIRRSRVQCAFVQRKNDVELAAACCEAFESRPLPLTT
nr:MetaGeneMark_Unknown Function [uncultured bacterium]